MMSNIVSAVIPMIFNEKKQLLFVKSKKWSNKWVFPGGKAVVGERLEAAVRREVREELGIDLVDVIYWFFFQQINPKFYYKQEHFISFIFICKTKNENINLNEEAEEFQWIAPQKALLLDLQPDSKNALEIFLRDERYE